ncbi:hypothetical protein [Luteimonas kalidii]|uniref:DUF3644 domain-containing protein n=1 Tax=Luteimonas kalidii TaxID=3042025 RepID=A0ABT6JTC9_9GAMM|nr:hypothetical protein [Luteimonas kalidii]MDH5833949.1 hypothetical protein [Luteimonas kalidii]
MISKARQICESYLREEIRSNDEKGILPSKNRIAERLLARGDELVDVYEVVHTKLARDDIAWKILLGRLLTTAAFWSLEKIAQARAEEKALMELNQSIAKHAHALSDLLVDRDDLHNRSSFSSGTHYDICEVISEASAGNSRFSSYLKEPLDHLSSRFDMKYWPSLSSCIRVIGNDAQNAKTAADDPLTAAATRSTRPSKADFVRALRESIDEIRGDWLGGIPKAFTLSNDSMATLVNVLLDLPPDELVDGTYVKNLGRDKKPRISASTR